MRLNRWLTLAASVTLAWNCATAQSVSQMRNQKPNDASSQLAPARQQILQQQKAVLSSLPASAQDVIDRLGKLNHLPAGEWRYHVADMAHGESPTLDDSSWLVATPRSNYSQDAFWFRQWVVVPKSVDGYDLNGATIWFHFDATSLGGAPQIVYLNGRRVALGEDLEPIELFQDAKPGEKILVAVKLLATSGAKRFLGSTMKIDFAKDRPDPEDLRTEFLAATALIPTFPNSTQDRNELYKAIKQVNLTALQAGDQQGFDASLRAAQGSLQALKPEMSALTVHLTGNSHIDAAWKWPWVESVQVVRNTYATALQLMDEYPAYTFTQSAAAYNDWLSQYYPDINAEIKKRIKEGRWEVVGGMWVEPDLNLPDGESTARSLLIGKRWYLKHYGVDVRIGWNPDSFGYNWQLPQIYKKSGVDYFVTQKLGWNDTNQLPFKLFWWESPDGSKVLTYFPHGYGNRDLSPSRLANDFARARTDVPSMTEMMDLYGVSDHGGGPTRAMLDQGIHWMGNGAVVPVMKFGTALSYFQTEAGELADQSPEWNYRSIAKGFTPPPIPSDGKIEVPTWKDELYLEFHRGTYTTQSHMKKLLRESSEWALNAEKYASLAWLDGDHYPGEELTAAWKKIAFNDFHDLAAGSGITAIYKDAQKDYQDVRWSTSRISDDALHTIESKVDTLPRPGVRMSPAVPLFVFNPLAWQRSGPILVNVQMREPEADVSVLDPQGHVIPSQILKRDAKTNTFKLLIEAKDIPSMGYEVLQVVPGERHFASDLHVTGTTLENDSLRITVDPKTGCITSLYQKKADFETLSPGSCGNELEAYRDEPARFDAWNIDPRTLTELPTLLNHADSVQVVQRGPVRAAIRVVRTWRDSKFVQEIQLDADSDQAVVVNDIDWHEKHVLLKTAFTLTASGPFATYEIPFGSIQRPTTRNNSWEQAQWEVPALRWADLGDASRGFSLINESKFGYDAKGNVLRLSLLRATTSPDPTADQGHHHFRYALYPHAGSWKQAMTVRRGYDFDYRLKAMPVEAHAGAMASESSFVSVTPDNVTLTAMKKAEDSHALIFHMYEWAGKSGEIELTVPPGATGAVETNLMEKPVGDRLPLNGSRVTVAVKPYEIVAVRVDYP